jgi:hypothetical protein
MKGKNRTRSHQHSASQQARAYLRLAFCSLLAPALTLSLAAQSMPSQPPAPIERRAPAQAGSTEGQPGGLHRGPRGEHLAQWMSQHSNLSPQQQQQALQQEPGFQQLPQQVQQRMRERLTQLDAMTPEQRQRLLARNEAMERLAPDQRAEVRGAMSQLGQLPPDQRRAVAQTFRSLTALPADQRLQAYNGGRYTAPLNNEQRSVLSNLLKVEPLLGPMLLPHGGPHPGPRTDIPVQTLR